MGWLTKLKRLTKMAKRNKTTNRQKKSGRSPYAKYNKAPYKYSPAYYSWLGSVKRGVDSSNKYKEQADNREYRRAA